MANCVIKLNTTSLGDVSAFLCIAGEYTRFDWAHRVHRGASQRLQTGLAQTEEGAAAERGPLENGPRRQHHRSGRLLRKQRQQYHPYRHDQTGEGSKFNHFRYFTVLLLHKNFYLKIFSS